MEQDTEDVMSQDSQSEDDTISESEEFPARNDSFIESDGESSDSDDDDSDAEELPVEGAAILIRRRGPHIPFARQLRLLRRPFFRILGQIAERGGLGSWIENADDYHPNMERPENITFDQNLPTSHSYLGEMDECSGVQYIDRESYVVLPILQVPDFILVPGQTMPLDISRPQDISLLQNVLFREDKTFGVLLLRHSATQIPVEYGCTAELRSIREEEVHEIQTMVGIAIGRQRFKIMERRTQPNGNLIAKVQILSDEEQSAPASGAMLNVHRKWYAASARRLAQRQINHDRSLVSAGMLTGNPPWMYRMYDVNYLRKLIIEDLRDWYPKIDGMALPVSPSAFSFWILSHCIMTNAMRLELLQIDSSVHRLRCALDILRKFTLCTCVGCGNEITERRHIFNMSVSGPMNAYVNPSGHIHETLTVYSAKGLFRVSRPSKEHSWFPGYAWTICQCDSCGRHIGWRFQATKPSLVPKAFWGLTRSALNLHMEVKEETSEGNSNLLQQQLTRSSTPPVPPRPGSS